MMPAALVPFDDAPQSRRRDRKEWRERVETDRRTGRQVSGCSWMSGCLAAAREYHEKEEREREIDRYIVEDSGTGWKYLVREQGLPVTDCLCVLCACTVERARTSMRVRDTERSSTGTGSQGERDCAPSCFLSPSSSSLFPCRDACLPAFLCVCVFHALGDGLGQ